MNNLWINGQSEVPPGFRFHPTEEELLHYYLTKKLSSHKIDLHVIPEIDLNKLEPWDIQEMCKIGFSPQNECYFFSQRDKKYPSGTRTNRATAAGFWKATGRDKIIHNGSSRIGLRKTLVFYKGRAPRGDKSDWIMHEYRLDYTTVVELERDSNIEEEGWVVCRLFKKKNHHKATNSMVSKLSQMLSSCGNNKDVVDQILVCMGKISCKIETESIISNNVMGSSNNGMSSSSQPFKFNQDCFGSCHQNPMDGDDGSPSAWAAVDRLVASQLNGSEADTASFLPARNGSHSSEWPSQVISVSDSDIWGAY